MKITFPLIATTTTTTRKPSLLNTFLSFLLLLVTPSISIDQGYDDHTIAADPERVVRESAPLWLLPIGTCLPTSAVSEQGIQNNGTESDICQLYGSLNSDCPIQTPFDGSYSKSTAFPTYFLFRYCPNVNQYRVLYDLYFQKDTGHKHDWEWAAITFKQNQTTDWRWRKDKLILQNEGTNSVFDWKDIPEAYSEGDDIHNNSGPNGDHPKLYIGKFRHSVHMYPFTSALSKRQCMYNGAPVYGNWDYREADFYYPAQEWLVSGDVVRKGWTWGKSDSPPPAFLSDGKYDLCYLRVDVSS
ncbi:hypothetical protein ABW19_dt0208990 [Dactylella cylindrospora]|nr:hypothetical protein ABW19_dt0208990 [Dactylella cylindrospora]